MTSSPVFCVLGAGSWGTALASHLARCGHPVTLWGRSASDMQAMAESGCNERYLPGCSLDTSLSFSSDLEASLRTCSEVLVSVPSHSFAAMVEQINAHAPAQCRVLWACKGFEPQTRGLLSEVAADKRPQQAHAIVSGPSFAAELVAGLPTAVTVASNTEDYARQV
ncbi:MAG: 2-dehydropantoate 2-reductase N-terminal domain-containing protein, partial [Pseudomonadota bacterium]